MQGTALKFTVSCQAFSSSRISLSPGTAWGRTLSFTPQPLYPLKKKLTVPIGLETGWFGCFEDEKNFLFLPRN
jgi:hypothetical protein